MCNPKPITCIETAVSVMCQKCFGTFVLDHPTKTIPVLSLYNTCMCYYSLLSNRNPSTPTLIRKSQRYLIWNSPALFVPSYHLPSTPRALENFCMLSSLLSTMALYRLHRDCLSSCVSLSYRPWSNNTSWAWPFTSFLINTVKDTKKNLRHL